MEAFILAGLQLLPLIIEAGENAIPLVESMTSIFQGRAATDADWAQLHAIEDAARAKLNDKTRDVPA